MYILLDLNLLVAWHAKYPFVDKQESFENFMKTIGTNRIWGREKDIPMNSLQLTDFAIEMDERFAIRYCPNETYTDMLQRIRALPSKDSLQKQGDIYFLQGDH